jgi:hypothetical protein
MPIWSIILARKETVLEPDERMSCLEVHLGVGPVSDAKTTACSLAFPVGGATPYALFNGCAAAPDGKSCMALMRGQIVLFAFLAGAASRRLTMLPLRVSRPGQE